MPNLKPFRDYDEHDVVNLFAYDGTSVNKGTLVKISSTAGYESTDEMGMDHGVSTTSYGNTVSQRYNVAALVENAASGDTPLGMLLYDVRETDENGEKLLYNPRKAAEMQVAISGQAVPVATKGLFLVNGVDHTAGAITPGAKAYAADSGLISTNSDGTVQVGTFLGGFDSNSDVLVKLNL